MQKINHSEDFNFIFRHSAIRTKGTKSDDNCGSNVSNADKKKNADQLDEHI